MQLFILSLFQLQLKGFYDIDALDGSPEMLKIAEGKGCYQKLYNEFIGEEQTSISSSK